MQELFWGLQVGLKSDIITVNHITNERELSWELFLFFSRLR